MPTFTALTTLRDKSRAEALAEACEDLIPEPTGVGVFEVEDGTGTWEVGAYFIEQPDDIALSLLAAAHDAKPFAISELPETDWVAHVRRELAPIRAGRFFLYGSHDADQVPEDCVPLLIEAAMAFGTGHHGTTQGCLQALHDLDTKGFRGKNVVDVGCGTAVLAMAAAKIWQGVVLASDIDEVATDTAAANVTCNDLNGRVEIVTCAGFEHDRLREKAPYDLIFANILKGPLIALAPDMGKSCETGGHVILSGLLNEQADDVKAAYTAQGFDLVDHLIVGEWSTLCLQKKP
ncbi:50S ribosomal protein L11 methyltransferase [Neptunicoccus cionae]|uniref:Ribosomal protein L11 methyltransferase n=1 Tax=Neptunicoccus cionae TaxID=2035344 RepID=A0A916QVF7_9RHOB|nr:50S ribosomal protein L11 methyltransferase [Amylibacter cionae]GGA14420.1 ribosomal protein L11 methyltransferase [Amylibacter cionae]